MSGWSTCFRKRCLQNLIPWGGQRTPPPRRGGSVAGVGSPKTRGLLSGLPKPSPHSCRSQSRVRCDGTCSVGFGNRRLLYPSPPGCHDPGHPVWCRVATRAWVCARAGRARSVWCGAGVDRLAGLADAGAVGPRRCCIVVVADQRPLPPCADAALSSIVGRVGTMPGMIPPTGKPAYRSRARCRFTAPGGIPCPHWRSGTEKRGGS